MAAGISRQPSSVTTGFFQAHPEVPPGYISRRQCERTQRPASDCGLVENIVNLYLPNPLPDTLDNTIHQFAQTCLDPKTLRLMVDCETNHPTLQLLNTFGEVNETTPLWTSEGWRGLKDIQTRAGVVAHGYQRIPGVSPYNLRIHQFILAYLWSPSCASVSCPAAMSDGAAILLSKHLASSTPASHPSQDAAALRRVLQEAYDRLTSFDPAYAWTSGQWMTERPGGSDVSRTETLAHIMSKDELDADRKHFGGADADNVDMPLGPWVIDGFKWFSSATDADMVVLLAQTQRGLSAFYAPMKRQKMLTDGKSMTVMNGVRISRLKNKLGTKGLPTAELEIRGMRGWLLGEEGRGVREISSILNATRLWTASGAVGGWGRGLAVARAYARVRKIKGEQVLADNRLHVKWMADETVKYHACAHFAFFGIALLGISETGWDAAAQNCSAGQWLPRDKKHAELLLRMLTPVMKAQCSLWATWGLRECMESLGGVGYCENNGDLGVMNLSRLFRDGAVNSIWEGTTNILAEDFVRAVKGREASEALEALDALVEGMLRAVNAYSVIYARKIREQWRSLQTWLTTTSFDEMLYHGREALRSTQAILSALLLVIDATATQSAREQAIADRWISWQAWQIDKGESGQAPGRVPLTASPMEGEKDRQIFLGVTASQGAGPTQSKL